MESGRTPEVTILLSAIDEQSDPKALSPIADAIDDAVRAWSPVEWTVLVVELLQERSDSHDSEGRTYQSITLTYRIILARA